MDLKRKFYICFSSVVVIAIFTVLILNFFVFTGFYNYKGSSNKISETFEKLYRFELPKSSKVESMSLNKAFFISQGILVSKLHVPKDSINEVISNIKFYYIKEYPADKEDLKSFTDTEDLGVEPYLMGEIYDPNIIYETQIEDDLTKNNIKIDYVIRSNSNYFWIYISEEDNNTIYMYFRKTVFGAEISYIQKSLSFRRWF